MEEVGDARRARRGVVDDFVEGAEALSGCVRSGYCVSFGWSRFWLWMSALLKGRCAVGVRQLAEKCRD